MAAALGRSPSALRGRPQLTTYEYDEQGRVARAFTTAEWTPEDRALMLARAMHAKTLCPKCGHPKETAWHPDNEGWFEVVDEFVCHACTTLETHGLDANAPSRPVTFLAVADTRDYQEKPLPPMPMSRRLDPAALEEAMGGAL